MDDLSVNLKFLELLKKSKEESDFPKLIDIGSSILGCIPMALLKLEHSQPAGMLNHSQRVHFYS